MHKVHNIKIIILQSIVTVRRNWLI